MTPEQIPALAERIAKLVLENWSGVWYTIAIERPNAFAARARVVADAAREVEKLLAEPDRQTART